MKKVIYTAIVGNYDQVYQPIVDDSFDYILFSNDIVDTMIGVWQIRKIPYENDDKTRIARYVKTHSHLLLTDYDYSVWVDSNLIIMSSHVYEIFDKLYEENVLVSSFSHVIRDCVYDECLAIALLNKDRFYNMLDEILFLKDKKYPHHIGLCETNCVFRCHKDSKVIDVNDQWWEMIEVYSKRDQLSFNYTLWNNGFEFNYLLGQEHNSRNHPFFKCTEHMKVSHDNWVWNHKIKGIPLRLYPYLYKKVLEANRYSFHEKFFIELLLWIDAFFHFCLRLSCKYLYK